MQDFQSIPGFAGRIFSSSAGGSSSDAAARRLRGYPSGQPHHLQPPVKCPRCDSSNTKFCYYNNYNLSQPRHFCKSCRRYWTKGGVLRNVPVGGGCRKNSKRSSSSKSAAKSDHRRRRPSSASGSSSDSAASAPNPSLNAEPSQTLDPDPVMDPAPPEVFAEPAGSFTNLVAEGMLGFEFLDPAAGFRAADPGPDPQQKMEGIGMGEQAVGMDLAAAFQGRMDWPPPPPPPEAVVDSGGLFDLTSCVDPAVYWNQGHWGDTDPSLYLP